MERENMEGPASSSVFDSSDKDCLARYCCAEDPSKVECDFSRMLCTVQQQRFSLRSQSEGARKTVMVRPFHLNSLT